MLTIREVLYNNAIAEKAAIALFQAYAIELGANLGFQGFDKELASPLAKYGPPNGCLILAYWENEAVGCVAIQPLETGICEMKRLFVQPAYRKHKIGEALVEHILTKAKQIGYSTMLLDTLERLEPAIALYKKFGFTITQAYYSNPLPNVVYMRKSLPG
jgi:GNAT superfamily N-acetyltransferase